ncbi:MAG: alpha/beta fold hydrolase [Betaproteobacteria bacterium]|nr:alpha/beta fold hydrolase [Betaproteobacteria bacterium]
MGCRILPDVPVLASFARAMLFAELSLSAGLAALLHGAGASLGAALAAVIICDLAVRAAITINSFAASSVIASHGDEAGLSLAARVRLVATEAWWTAVAFSVLMPFPRLGGSMDSALPRSGVPVLLVHGYLCNHGIWRAMKRFLESHGIGVWTHDAEPLFAGIDEYVASLAARIETILERTRSETLVIVGHSMGGLVLRAYLRAHGGRRVALGITLGTPHYGTQLARRGLGRNAREMEPGSPWLEELARAEAGVLAARVVSIWSRHDNVVAPQESARLEGAENIAIEGVGHVALVFSSAAQSLVLEKILVAAKAKRAG